MGHETLSGGLGILGIEGELDNVNIVGGTAVLDSLVINGSVTINTISGSSILSQSEDSLLLSTGLIVPGNVDVAGSLTVEGQTVSRQGVSIIEIFSMGDFPMPIEGVITLPSGKYIIKNNITTSDRFSIGSGGNVTIEVEDFRNNILTYTGDETLFTSIGAARIAISLFNILCTGTNATVFDITEGSVTIDNGQIMMIGSNSTLGSIIDGDTVVFRNLTLLGYTNAVTITNANALLMNELLMQGNLTGTGALFSINGSIGLTASSSAIASVTGLNESIFYIDPVITANITISDTILLGEGTFFKTGSLDETSKYITTIRNGVQKDSANIGSMIVGGNSATTIIVSQDTYVDLNLAGAVIEASDIELWTLTNTITGELRYDGVVPVSLNCTGLVSAFSIGGTQRFNFRLLKNGLSLPSPDNVDIPLEIRATIGASPLLWSIEVSPGDLFRLQVANADGMSNITIDTLKVSIS